MDISLNIMSQANAGTGIYCSSKWMYKIALYEKKAALRSAPLHGSLTMKGQDIYFTPACIERPLSRQTWPACPRMLWLHSGSYFVVSLHPKILSWCTNSEGSGLPVGLSL
jgi:hypothetical protein